MKKNNLTAKLFNLSLVCFIFVIFYYISGSTAVLADSQLNDQCVSNSDCALGLFCDSTNGNTCQNIIQGTVCTTASDCGTSKTGLTCVSGKCAPPPNNNPNQYPIGQPKNGGSCGTTDPNIIKAIQGHTGAGYDGVCGTDTIKAIQIWQQSHNLTDDGIMGPDTFAAMGISLASTDTTVTPGTTGSSGPCPTGLTPGPAGICLPPQTCTGGFCDTTSLSDLILKVINLLLGLAGAIAVGVLIIGGYWYITSAGNEEQAEKGQKTLINAIIGIVVVLMSYVIVTVIANTISKTS